MLILATTLLIGLVYAAGNLQDAHRQYKTGQFLEAIKTATALNTAEGFVLAAKASNVLAGTQPTNAQEQTYSQAETYARKALQANPKNADAYAELSRALGRLSQLRGPLLAVAQGLVPQIRDNAEQALRLEPQNLTALISLAIWHAEVTSSGIGDLMGGNNTRALELIQQAAAAWPKSPTVKLEHARILLKADPRKNREAATQQLEQGLKLNPEDAADQLELERIKIELMRLRAGK